MKYHECSECERNTNNCKDRFRTYNGKWYCSKHYQQIKKYGEIYFKKNKYGGINDMPRGWITENDLNKRVYILWMNMLMRCGNDYKNIHKTYSNASCNDFIKLSDFNMLIKNIYNYDLWKDNPGLYELDKDIKSNGKNKKYSVDNCMFVLKSENISQSNKTRDTTYLKNENNYQSRKIIQYDLDMNIINIFNCIKEASEKTHVIRSGISACCRGKRKMSGGYIWRYYDEVIKDEQ